MTNPLTQFGELFALQFLQVTLLTLLVGLIVLLFGRNRPYLALSLWVIVLVKCVTPPLVYSPCGVFCWMEIPDAGFRQSARQLQVSVVAEHISLGEHNVHQPAMPHEGSLEYASTPDGRGNEVSVCADDSWTALFNWSAIGLSIWLAGVAVMLWIFVTNSCLFLWCVKRDRVRPTTGTHMRIERLVQRLSNYVGLRHTPRLIVSSGNVGPAVFGVLRPTVVLPLSLVRTCTTRQLTPMVLHELIHIRRGDLWLALHSAVVRAIWWFHPLVWWSVRRAEWESERCCDESVVARMRREPARYAHSLITTLEQAHQLKTSLLVPGMRPVDITAKRLERIMRLGQGSHKRMPLSCWVLSAVAAAIILPGATGGWAQPPLSGQRADRGKGDLPPTARLASRPRPIIEGSVLHTKKEDPNRNIQSAHQADSTYIATYAVADLLDKLKRDEFCPEDAPNEHLKTALLALLSCFSRNALESPRADIPVQPANTDVASPAEHETHFHWVGDQLVFSGTKSEHARLKNELERRRRYSFKQVSVEVRIMQGRSDLCAPEDSAPSADLDDRETRWRNRWILFQQEFANLESPTQLPPLSMGVDHGDQREDLRNALSAAVTTDRSEPIVYQFLDDRRFKDFITFLQGERENSIILAPKVTFFDGQRAEISDISQRPFVTDVREVIEDQQVTYRQEVQLFWEGTRIQLSPEITPDGHRMQCRFMFASIDNCKTFRSPRFPDAKGVRIQHPVVSTATFQCAIDIPSGQTLLIGGLFPRVVERDAEQSMMGRWLGRQPAKIQSEQVTYISITPHNR